MNGIIRRSLAAGGLSVALAAAFGAAAPAEDADPPERVAVVDVVEGAAAAQPAGVGDWVGDVLNRPLTTGDRLWVDDGSRAELHLGSAALRLGANTALQFLNVGDQVAQLRLSAGSLNVRLRYLSPDETFEIDTPNTAVTLSQAGEYRIDVSDSGDDVVVAVWRGEAEVAGETQSFTLEPQQLGEFHGSGTLGVEFRDLPPADGLDQWAQYRDQREDALLTANYLSRDMTGYSDLEGYGTWQVDPDLGAVWQPAVPAGWVPYSQGYWVWIAPWGWTWVDRAPWGFAPFHYGRWVHVRTGWAWCPGQLAVRPVYAPALVVWANGAGGEVVWFPLGYNEIYRPSRRVSDAYLRRVNVTNTYISNTVTITNRTVSAPARYANREIPGALTVVDRETFTSARPVDRAARATAAALAAVTVVNQIAPGNRSLVPAASPGRVVAPPPRAVFARPVMARTAPPRVAAPAAAPGRVIVTNVPRAETRARPAFVPSAPASPTPSMPSMPSMPSPSPSPRTLPRVPDQPRARPAPEPATVPAPVPRVDRPQVLPRPPEPAETPRLPPPRIETPRMEPPRAVPQRVEPQRVEPSRVETPRMESPRVEPPRFEPPRVEPPRSERPQPELRREPAVPAPAEPARRAPDRTPIKPER